MRQNEYIVDRLNERINELEQELIIEKSTKTDMIVAEIVLAVVCFCAGCIVGAVYL
jgi:CHASE3 domain sensor protein